MRGSESCRGVREPDITRKRMLLAPFCPFRVSVPSKLSTGQTLDSMQLMRVEAFCQGDQARFETQNAKCQAPSDRCLPVFMFRSSGDNKVRVSTRLKVRSFVQWCSPGLFGACRRGTHCGHGTELDCLTPANGVSQSHSLSPPSARP